MLSPMSTPDPILLESGPARAAVALRGAEPVAWRVGDVPLLWTADPAWWARTAPVLFPVVGWSQGGRVRVDGVLRPMPVHGFAPAARFTVAERQADRVCLELADDAATRDCYPFAFRLSVEWRLASDRLGCTIAVGNPGDRTLPYSTGLHPGFCWPLAGARGQPPHPPSGRSGGRAGDRARRAVLGPAAAGPLRDGVELAVGDALFAEDALWFLDPAGHRVRYVNGRGAAVLVDAPEFPHTALWSRPGAPFVSVESWTGHGDAEGFQGELAARPSIRLLPAGARSSSRPLDLGRRERPDHRLVACDSSTSSAKGRCEHRRPSPLLGRRLRAGHPQARSGDGPGEDLSHAGRHRLLRVLPRRHADRHAHRLRIDLDRGTVAPVMTRWRDPRLMNDGKCTGAAAGAAASIRTSSAAGRSCSSSTRTSPASHGRRLHRRQRHRILMTTAACTSRTRAAASSGSDLDIETGAIATAARHLDSRPGGQVDGATVDRDGKLVRAHPRRRHRHSRRPGG
jgi:galactose mutarotase-like enzyme